MTGIVHPYYTVALAPAIAALVAIGGRELVLAARTPAGDAARVLLAAGVVATGVWSYVLLDRTPDWHPALRYGILAATALSTLLLLDPRVLQRGRRWVAVTGVLAVLALTAGPASYTLATAATPHTGSTPASGPSGVAQLRPRRGRLRRGAARWRRRDAAIVQRHAAVRRVPAPSPRRPEAAASAEAPARPAAAARPAPPW